MKYTYAYKDSDGKRHEAAIEAPSRDAAFAALREQGIRPIKVVAADGSKANGAPVGVRRRVMAVSIIVAVVAAGGSVVNYGRRLTERQDAEIAAYERTKADLERAKETMSGNALINYWESQNDKLRNLGIRPLTLESLEEYLGIDPSKRADFAQETRCFCKISEDSRRRRRIRGRGARGDRSPCGRRSGWTSGTSRRSSW